MAVRKAVDPAADGSGGWVAPDLNYGMRFTDYGSYGLRQFGGWVREEFLQELTGRQGARVYREMLDSSATVGSMIFAVQQAMRGVRWRVEPANDSAEAEKEAEFVDGLRDDMSHTWDSFITEALSMLGYGYSIHELVYKRRLGPKPEPADAAFKGDLSPSSKFNDGRIGWRRLPIRGQDVVLKWFFDPNGQIRGVTQQPWVGTLIDIPIEKMLLFRPLLHKNNPEGRSCLRNCYRSYYFTKRLEEMEAILVERMSGFPVLYVPTSLMDAANAPLAPGQTSNPQQAAAKAALEAYKNIVTGVRVNEQMGLLLPSDMFKDADGKNSSTRMYEFQLVTPQRTRGAETDKMIQRHKVDTLMTLICDFLMMGHEVRGTNNLSITRVDMFYSAIEGWLTSIADVINRYGLPRLWEMNSLNPDLMPKILPDMPQRLDLDSLGAFIANLAKSGMPLFPDDELQQFIREAAGFPLIEDDDLEDDKKAEPKSLIQQQAEADQQTAAVAPKSSDDMKKMLLGAMARRITKMRRNGQ